MSYLILLILGILFIIVLCSDDFFLLRKLFSLGKILLILLLIFYLYMLFRPLFTLLNGMIRYIDEKVEWSLIIALIGFVILLFLFVKRKIIKKR